MSKQWFKVLCVMSFLVTSACTGKPSSSTDPKQSLTDYISKSFAVKSPEDRKGLLDHLTGDSKIRMTAWSDDQFRQAFVDTKRQFLKLAYKEIKTVSPTEVSITYELSYIDQSRGRDAKVTNKKLCQMVLQSGHWLIADVRSIKELVEYKNEMSLP